MISTSTSKPEGKFGTHAKGWQSIKWMSWSARDLSRSNTVFVRLMSLLWSMIGMDPRRTPWKSTLRQRVERVVVQGQRLNSAAIMVWDEGTSDTRPTHLHTWCSPDPSLRTLSNPTLCPEGGLRRGQERHPWQHDLPESLRFRGPRRGWRPARKMGSNNTRCYINL